MKTLVIMGSARDESNTSRAVKELCPFSEYELIDLRKFKINPYRYHQPNGQEDDFEMIALKMKDADQIIFATPVYWYSMSAIMKNFFDRFSDLLRAHKSIGKSLKGKKVYLIATGADVKLPSHFEDPFRLTAAYFDMTYEKSFYLSAASPPL